MNRAETIERLRALSQTELQQLQDHHATIADTLEADWDSMDNMEMSEYSLGAVTKQIQYHTLMYGLVTRTMGDRRNPGE